MTTFPRNATILFYLYLNELTTNIVFIKLVKRAVRLAKVIEPR